MSRSTREVLDDHIRCRAQGDIEADVARNYAPQIVQLTMEGVFHGHDGVRENNTTLRRLVGDSDFEFPVLLVEGPYAFMEWRAPGLVRDGADSFVIEDGRIIFQSIRYTLLRGS